MLLDIIEVFLAGFVIDILYIFWVIKSSEKNRFQSALFSSLLVLPSMFGIVNVVEDHVLAIPYAVGLGVGSYVGISLDEYIRCRIAKR